MITLSNRTQNSKYWYLAHQSLKIPEEEPTQSQTGTAKFSTEIPNLKKLASRDIIP